MSTDSIAIIKAVFPANAQKYGLRDMQIQADIQAGYISKYTSARPQDCAQAHFDPSQFQQTSPEGVVGIFTTGKGSLGAKISSSINLALQAIPVVGQFLSQVWTTISPFAHHAAAVAREQTTLCTAVPEFDSALGQIEAALKSGNISATDADAYVDRAVQNFDTETTPIAQGLGGSGTCNAACVMQAEVAAVAEVNKQKFHDSPLYFLKHYWWIGAIIIAVLLLGRRT